MFKMLLAIFAFGTFASVPAVSQPRPPVSQPSGCDKPNPFSPGDIVICPAPCGRLDQQACVFNKWDQVYGLVPQGPGRCGGDGLINKLLKMDENSGVCEINTDSWIAKGLDMTRSELGCGGAALRSCWAVDDQDRDKLTFNTAALGFTTELKRGTTLPNGRYIYVLRQKDNVLLVRHYDRATDGQEASCLNYADYQTPLNVRGTVYLHVRHSQLVGNDQDKVWAAGEMRVTNGQIDRINNASGHYQPDVSAIRYVLTKLRLENIVVSPTLMTGPYSTIHAAEDESLCEQTRPFTGVTDDDPRRHDEL